MVKNNLITFYKQHFNLQNATFSRIDHEDAMVAIVYKVTQPTGLQLILKICTRAKDYWRELYFLKHFADTLPVPRILEVMQPEANIHGAILMHFFPGHLLTAADFTDSMAYEIGSLLAHIHQSRVPCYGDLIQPQDLYPDPHTYFTLKFEEGFAECSDNLPKTLLKQCRHYYDTHIHLLSAADGPCMVHRDFRPGNIMVHDGKLQGIIDWASGRASFAQEDFCPMEHGEWPTNLHNKKSFLAGYASVRAVPDYSSMMPLLRLSRAFATIGFMLKSGTWDNSHARVYQFNRLFLETLFSV